MSNIQFDKQIKTSHGHHNNKHITANKCMKHLFPLSQLGMCIMHIGYYGYYKLLVKHTHKHLYLTQCFERSGLTAVNSCLVAANGLGLNKIKIVFI
jgi:hypothetical protein